MTSAIALIFLGWGLAVTIGFSSSFYLNGYSTCRNIHTPFSKRTFFLPMTTSAKNVQDEWTTDFAEDDQGEETMDNIVPGEEDEEQLVLTFIQMVQTTPAGELEIDEVDLLREIMVQFADDKDTDAVDGVETALVVETLLRRLVTEWEVAMDRKDKNKGKAFRPTARDFEVAISAWANSDNPDKVFKVLSILSDQREIYLEDLPSAKPTLASMKMILDILAKSRERGIDKRAIQVFESLEELGLSADAEMYGLMVTIIAKSRAPRASERAEKMLRDAVEMFPPGLVNGEFTGVGVDAFNAVVVSYAKGGQEDGPKKAQELIAYMDQVDSENGSFGICSPNVKTFTSLIDAYCQQNEWESVTQADRILNRLLEQYLEGNEDLEPNVATWTIVINAWGRLSKKNRRGAADRAGKLLRRMEDLYQEGRINCKPDVITYVTCMNAYAFARGGEDAGEAEKLLEEMNELYLDGDDSMKPSARSVRVVADAWIKSGDMESAEQFLDDYEEYLYEGDDSGRASENTIDMYRSMLFGYTQLGNMERARFYLHFMIEKDMKPDNLCFDRVIEGYTKVGTQAALKQSLQVFELLEKCRRKGDIKPNERVYTSFIRGLTKGRAMHMHKKAETLLKRMHTLYEDGNEGIKPTVFTYNAVLNACAESIHVEGTSLDEAFKTSIRVFTELRNGRESFDHVTFGNLLRCAQLLPDGEKRDKFASATFRLCTENGFVNNFVIRDLQLATQEDLWRSLLNFPEGEPEMELLPSSWSYRIDKGRRPGGDSTFRDRGSDQNRNRGGGRGNAGRRPQRERTNDWR